VSILSRYVLREHVGPFFFGFGLITLVFVLNLVFRELGHVLSKGLPLGIILEFFALNLAWIVALAVPMAVLLACLMAFGRLSSDNEVTAFKASGVGLVRLSRPVVVTSAVLAAGLVVFNNAVLPEANHRLRLLASDISRKRPTVDLEPGVLYRGIPNFDVMVSRIHEREAWSRAYGVMIDDHSTDGVRKTIVADSADVQVDLRTGLLHLTLYHGEIHEVNLNELGSYRRLRFPRHRITLQVPGMVLVRHESDYRGDREKSAGMMLREIRENEALLREHQERLAERVWRTALRHLPWLGEEAPDSTSDKLRLFRRSLNDLGAVRAEYQRLLSEAQSEIAIIRTYQRTINSLRVEVHKKYSIPVACIVFALIGCPLGVMARRSDLAVSGGIGLFFFLFYWACLIGGEELADRGYIPAFWAMWTPNFVVGFAGLYLLFRTAREATFIPWDAWARSLRLKRRGEAES
jgi:lipopolysaccharide export system permease protein